MIIVSSVFTFLSETHQENVANKLKDMESNIQYLVLRHEMDDKPKLESVRSELLVPGDVIYLKPGFKVPADIVIIESNDLQVSFIFTR